VKGGSLSGKKLLAPSFAMTVPIYDTQGKVIGALAGATDLSKPNFLDKIPETHYGKTGGYLIVARQYRLIVTATNKSRIMATLPDPGINPMIDRFIQGYKGTLLYVNPLGIEQLASAKDIPVAGWYVNTTLPTAEAFSPIHAMQRRILLSTILFTLLAGTLIWLMTWQMLRRLLLPMLDVSRTLITLSDSDQPPLPLPITSQDEIGQLIGGFNRLLEALGKRESELRLDWRWSSGSSKFMAVGSGWSQKVKEKGVSSVLRWDRNVLKMSARSFMTAYDFEQLRGC
jgi:hypothetical protein